MRVVQSNDGTSQGNLGSLGNLGDLISRYYNNNENKKNFVKLVDKDNAQIKQIMLEGGLLNYEANGVKAVYGISKRFDFNEEILTALLKENLNEELLSKIVRTKEYLDYDALESAVYNKLIDPVLLQKAQTEKEVISLKISKVKEKKVEFEDGKQD